MSYKFSILFIVVLALITTSCVSKKKFLEMQTGRLQAEQQVRQLTQENNARAERIKAMIADFEIMKNELLESNAEKDQYIDNLNKEIAGLSNQLSQQKQSLQASTFTYGFEKERLAETLQARDKTIRSLESQIKNSKKIFPGRVRCLATGISGLTYLTISWQPWNQKRPGARSRKKSCSSKCKK